ncbi:Hypothetical predicted protein [Octopus vulgaris]|uniref:Uncharacterized protein n=1 Tax=Octopus vulgaris TaxID=6645 RepID=A0AA36BR27_OCTVU|nr:Hypothetical predicted protein [Octopus vulgaris]
MSEAGVVTSSNRSAVGVVVVVVAVVIPGHIAAVADGDVAADVANTGYETSSTTGAVGVGVVCHLQL